MTTDEEVAEGMPRLIEALQALPEGK